MSLAKEAAGRRAADLVDTGTVVGLGTGSTVRFALERLAERVRDDGLELRGVPTSVATESKARALGLPLASLDDVERIDVTIDGADEVDGAYQMIKGGGGALLREKVVAALTEREIVIVGRDKLVETLGIEFLLPVEVVPFARAAVARRVSVMGARAVVRMRDQDTLYLTDNGNEILDCAFEGGIPDPASLERALDEIPGIVETGLFVDLCHVLVIGDEDGGVEVREKG